MWYLENKEFDGAKAIEDGYLGFVYCITDLTSGMKYIGKKHLLFSRKKPPLKGKKRKRVEVIESDWRTYYGSSDEVKSLVEQKGTEKFHREILHLCRTKGEMSYWELYEQLSRHVLLKPEEYHNAYVGCRIHRKHVLKS